MSPTAIYRSVNSFSPSGGVGNMKEDGTQSQEIERGQSNRDRDGIPGGGEESGVEQTGSSGLSRRRMLKTSGAVAVAGALAGCEGVDDGAFEDLDTPTPDPLAESRTVLLDPESVRWWALRNMTEGSFTDRNDTAHQQGMMLVDIGFDERAERYYGIWQENIIHEDLQEGYDWHAVWDDDFDDFGDDRIEYRDDGYRLIEQERYVKDGSVYYAGAYIENVYDLEWRSHRNHLEPDFESRRDSWEDDFLPIDIYAYESSDGPRYGSIWVENIDGLDWKLERDLSPDEYGNKFSEYSNDGYRVFDLESYMNGGDQQFAAIWIENTARKGFQGRQEWDTGGARWAAYRHMSPQRYGERIRQLKDIGFRPISLSIDDIGGSTEHAAVWRQDAVRATWTHRTNADDTVQDFIEDDDNQLPSISAAVMKDGVLVYRRGFVNTDVSNQRELGIDGRSIFRLASVSKPVAGILSVLLEENGQVDLSDETQSLLGPLTIDAGSTTVSIDMPAHHDHTLEDLLSNRGCVKAYGPHAHPGGRVYRYFANARHASFAYYDGGDEETRFWDEELISGCEIGEDYEYSTHGFTYLGAALEQETGTDVDELIETHLSEPYNLSTLQAEDRREPHDHRASVYDHNDSFGGYNQELQEWDDGESPPSWLQHNFVDSLNWKILGGGMEASTYDMVRLGNRLIEGDILSPDGLEKLWTPTSDDEDYALGWRVDGEFDQAMLEDDYDGDDDFVARHGGDQPGGNANWRIYPADNLVIAVMANRRGVDGVDRVENVAVDLADMVLDD